jgi:hypothetical protein
MVKIFYWKPNVRRIGMTNTARQGLGWWGLPLAVLGPIIGMSVYLTVSELMAGNVISQAGPMVLVFCLALGVYFLWQIPAPVEIRVIIIILYCPVFGWFLFFYALYFSGFLFGKWV